MIICGYNEEDNMTYVESDHVIIFRPDDFGCSTKIGNTLKELGYAQDTKLTITNCSEHGIKQYDALKNYFDFKYVSFTTYYVFETINYMMLLNRRYEPNNPSEHFCCLNNKARIGRCKLIDALAKHNLLSKYTTWHETDSNYDFKYFDNKKRILDVLEGTELSFELFNPPEKAFIDSVWSITCEYMDSHYPNDIIEITEKIFIPMAHKKPVLVFGPKDYYKELKLLGFKTHDNIIDYSFDSVDDLDERLNLFIKEMVKLKNRDISETLSATKNIVDHNFKNLVRIVKYRIKNKHGDKVSDEEMGYIKRLLKSKNVEARIC